MNAFIALAISLIALILFPPLGIVLLLIGAVVLLFNAVDRILCWLVGYRRNQWR
jgi:hypothetical protein